MHGTQLLGRGVGNAAGLQVRQTARAKPSLRHRVRSTAQEDVDVEDKGEASAKDKQAAAASGETIYIGFDKSDTASRAGRKGRVVTDDPSRYPEKDSLTGGWAGGEVGLKQFIQEEKDRKETVQKATIVEKEEVDGKTKAKAVTTDGEEIYLGFSKTELEQRKAGGRGRSIRDDPRKYPNKENLGIFSGITGGFAGGEKGVQQFVKSGEIKIDESQRREFSPVVIAAVVAGGVTTGAILLNSGVLLSEQAIQGTLQAGSAVSSTPETTDLGFSIDENTKNLLNAALALLGVGSLVIGARSVTKRLQESTVQLKDDAVNVGKIAVFWILVLVAALYIIDSQ